MINKSQIMTVYSGKVGCMCGCNGKWKVASAHVAAATKHRGYAYEAEDISDRSVSIVCSKLNKATGTRFDNESNCYHVQVNGRQYAAYMMGAK